MLPGSSSSGSRHRARSSSPSRWPDVPEALGDLVGRHAPQRPRRRAASAARSRPAPAPGARRPPPAPPRAAPPRPARPGRRAARPPGRPAGRRTSSTRTATARRALERDVRRRAAAAPGGEEPGHGEQQAGRPGVAVQPEARDHVGRGPACRSPAAPAPRPRRGRRRGPVRPPPAALARHPAGAPAALPPALTSVTRRPGKTSVSLAYAAANGEVTGCSGRGRTGRRPGGESGRGHGHGDHRIDDRCRLALPYLIVQRFDLTPGPPIVLSEPGGADEQTGADAPEQRYVPPPPARPPQWPPPDEHPARPTRTVAAQGEHVHSDRHRRLGPLARPRRLARPRCGERPTRLCHTAGARRARRNGPLSGAPKRSRSATPYGARCSPRFATPRSAANSSRARSTPRPRWPSGSASRPRPYARPCSGWRARARSRRCPTAASASRVHRRDLAELAEIRALLEVPALLEAGPVAAARMLGEPAPARRRRPWPRRRRGPCRVRRGRLRLPPRAAGADRESPARRCRRRHTPPCAAPSAPSPRPCARRTAADASDHMALLDALRGRDLVTVERVCREHRRALSARPPRACSAVPCALNRPDRARTRFSPWTAGPPASPALRPAAGTAARPPARSRTASASGSTSARAASAGAMPTRKPSSSRSRSDSVNPCRAW